MQAIILEETKSVIEVEDEPSIIVVEETGVSIVSVAEQGPPGPPGASGSGVPYSEELTIGLVVPTTHVLTHIPMANSIALFINGLRQSSTSFSVASQTVNLPGDLQLEQGDWIAISYLF
jgi:hypothetical protein